MTRPLRLVRTAFAAIGGLLLAGALAAPAAAAPASFEVSDTGEDRCTFYDAKGEAEWSGLYDPAVPQVRITGLGEISHAEPGTVCLDVEPAERRIEFTAFYRDEPVDTHVEPFDRMSVGPGPGIVFSYDFTLAGLADAPVEYVTVAICKVDDVIGERCTEPAVVGPDAE